MDEWTAQINANIKTFKLDWKTARFVASALDEWLANKITQLNALGEADDPDGWDWNDIPIISGAIKIIRSSEDHTP
jgi:UDP-glucose 6-dehydrogenase